MGKYDARFNTDKIFEIILEEVVCNFNLEHLECNDRGFYMILRGKSG